jgi:hypothetical protein
MSRFAIDEEDAEDEGEEGLTTRGGVDGEALSVRGPVRSNA